MNGEFKNPTRCWKIFLVEDSATDVRLTQEVLSNTGLSHDLHVARDGEQALYMIRREGEHAGLPEPDLVLLDLNLPRKNGREVLAALKTDPRFNHIPVLVLTTSQSADDIAECYQLQANCYLVKPIDLDAFVEMVHGVKDFWFGTAAMPPSMARPRPPAAKSSLQ